MSDLNAMHPLLNGHGANQAGFVLYIYVQQSDYTVFVPITLTHFPGHPGYRPDVLDVTLIKLPHYYTEVFNLNDLSSDHNPILINISNSPISSFHLLFHDE